MAHSEHGQDPTKNKINNFGQSARRFVSLMFYSKGLFILALGLAAVSVVITVLVPKILGGATDLVVKGAIGWGFRQDGPTPVPPGMTKEQVLEVLKASGDTQAFDFLNSIDFTPGVGIDFRQLGTVLMLVILLYCATAFFSWAEGWVMARIVARASYELRREVEDKLARLPMSYYHSNSRGDIMSRVTNDIDNITTALNQMMSQVVILTLTILSILVMMFYISPTLAVISLVTLPLSAIFAAVIMKLSQPRFMKQWSSTGELNGTIEETFTGQNIVTIFGQEEKQLEKFKTSNDAVYKAASRAQFLSSLLMPVTNFVSNLGYVAIAVVGALRVAAGTISIGDVQAFIQYSRQFSMNFGQLMGMSSMMQSGIASAERVFEVLDAPEEQPTPPPLETLEQVKGDIRFENVYFSYSKDKPLIEDLSLEAKPGQTIAIVGPTGAGKTTLVNLLMRFYELDSGVIRCDGKDIAHVKRDDLRRNFGMVLQDTWLFNGTIRDNLAYGAQDLEEQALQERVEQGARIAYIDHFIQSLPEGYDTVLNDEGMMSQGQRQLMTIARAWIADPAILILDEATSSVDTRTEALIQQAMAKLRQSRTSFVIAHRLSTIRDADTILVLNNGSIVEQGNQEHLLKAKGFYYNLYMSQFNEPMTEEEHGGPAEYQTLAGKIERQ